MTGEPVTILCVDDEVNILGSLKRLFMEEDLSVVTAESGDAALEYLGKNQVAAIVSDNLMPNMTGIEFFQRAKQLAPDSIRILMTGYADVQSAIDAINKGEVYRFVTKPWDNAELREVVRDAVGRHKIVTAMRGASENTLLSLAQTLELKDPYTRGHCDRVARYAVGTAERLGLAEEDIKHIRYGSWLHDCGKIGVPEAILNSSGSLSPEQMNVMKNHSQWGAEVARLANLPETVVSIVLCHHEKYDGTGYPGGLRADRIPYQARIVTVADFYDALSTERPYRKAVPLEKVFEIMLNSRGTHVDPQILDIFLKTVKGN